MLNVTGVAYYSVSCRLAGVGFAILFSASGFDLALTEVECEVAGNFAIDIGKLPKKCHFKLMVAAAGEGGVVLTLSGTKKSGIGTIGTFVGNADGIGGAVISGTGKLKHLKV
jgi:hypothetical protein